MQVILREDVHNLGKSGELVDVKNGYARNYLLPRNMAVLASEANMRQLRHMKQVIALRQQKLKGAAEDLRQRLNDTHVTIARKVGAQDKLYGSVTALDIAEALTKMGLQLDRRSIRLHEPIRSIGFFEVEVRLHRGVTAKLPVTVTGEAT